MTVCSKFNSLRQSMFTVKERNVQTGLASLAGSPGSPTLISVLYYQRYGLGIPEYRPGPPFMCCNLRLFANS